MFALDFLFFFSTFLLDREDVFSLMATVWRPVFLLVLRARDAALLLKVTWSGDFAAWITLSRLVYFVGDELFLFSGTCLESLVFSFMILVKEDFVTPFFVSLNLTGLWSWRLFLFESCLVYLERRRLATVVAFFSEALRKWFKGNLRFFWTEWCFFLSDEEEAFLSVVFLSRDFDEGRIDANL